MWLHGPDLWQWFIILARSICRRFPEYVSSSDQILDQLSQQLEHKVTPSPSLVCLNKIKWQKKMFVEGSGCDLCTDKTKNNSSGETSAWSSCFFSVYSLITDSVRIE